MRYRNKVNVLLFWFKRVWVLAGARILQWEIEKEVSEQKKTNHLQEKTVDSSVVRQTSIETSVLCTIGVFATYIFIYWQ